MPRWSGSCRRPWCRRAAPAPEELRHRLARALPAYLVPARFVTLPELPRTASGKLDRVALARLPLAPAQTTVTTASAAPRSPLEELLVAQWSELLGRPAGIHDDFFALGGHSLLATRLCARLAAASTRCNYFI